MARKKAGIASPKPAPIPRPVGKSERPPALGLRHASDDQFADIIRWAPIGIFRVRRDGTFIAVNQFLSDMLGYASRSELETRNLERDIYFDPSQRRAILI